MRKRALYLVSAMTSALLLDAGVASAAPVTVTGPFYFRENRGVNDMGVIDGDRLVFGAQASPNGDMGTTATRYFGNTPPDPLPALNFNPSTANPNQFSGSLAYDSNVAALAVNMAFNNGLDTTLVSRSAVGSIGLMPLAFDLGVSGSGTNLTFNWTIPAIPSGLTLERAQILVYDHAEADSFYSAFLASPTATSYELPGAFASTLELGHKYAFGIRLEDLRTGVNPTVGPARLSSSQAYLNFTPTAPIPEPETYALMVVGLGLVGWQLRRRKQRAAVIRFA